MSQFLEFKCNLESFIGDLESILESNTQALERLLKEENKSYASFVKPMQQMEEELEHFFTPLSHLNAVNNSDKTQEVYTNSLPIITQYSTQLSQNLEIYTAYKEILQKEENSLNYEQKRVLKLNIEHFELSGAHLDKETKKRLEEINLRKSELSNNFSQNLLDATNAYEYIITESKDIEGLPQSDIEAAKFEEDGVSKYALLSLPL